MKTVTSIITSLCLLTQIPLSASQETHKRAAENLVEIMGTKVAFKSAFTPVFNNQIQQALAAQGISQGKIDRIKEAGGTLADNIVNDPKYMASMGEIYVEAFSEDEIKDLITFYETPTGKKVIKMLPILSVRGAQIGDTIAADYMVPFQAEMEKILLEEE